MRRFFVPLDSIRDGACVIEGSDAKHLTQVLRISQGGEFEATDGRGNRLRLRVRASAPARVECDILETVPVLERTVEVTLFQAVPRQFKMDEIVRFAVELGVTTLVPVLTERSAPRYDPKLAASKFERWQRIALETAKRVGRTTALRLEPVVKPEALPGLLAGDTLRLMPWELERDRTLKSALRESGGARKAELLIGAEGGFSAEEASRFAGMGFVPVTLGKRVLTVETAVLTTLACLYYELED